MSITLKNEKTSDRWLKGLTEGQGKSEEIFKNTENFILKPEAPEVKYERVKANPGFFAGVIGNERSFIRVINKNLSIIC